MTLRIVYPMAMGKAEMLGMTEGGGKKEVAPYNPLALQGML